VAVDERIDLGPELVGISSGAGRDQETPASERLVLDLDGTVISTGPSDTQ
jgi:hypothetical protein